MTGGWYITNRVAAGAVAEAEIYDSIGEDGVRASEFLASLGGAQEVELRVNSEGGSLFDAIVIYNRLRELRRVSVTVDGLAASAASVVAMAASRGRLAMGPLSRMFIHEARAEAGGGTSAELAALSAVLDGLSDEIAGIYAGRSGVAASHWRQLMAEETWFTASQAVAAGLADTVRPDPWEAVTEVLGW